MTTTNSVNFTICDRECIVNKRLRSFYAHQSSGYCLLENWEHNYPAQRGRHFTSSGFSGCFSGKLRTACTSIIRFTVSTIPGKWSISQRAASALARYVRASSSSILARLVCCAAWSKQASSICCRTSLGFLQSSRNSKEGKAGTCFTGTPWVRYCAGRRIVTLGSIVASQTFVTLLGGLR